MQREIDAERQRAADPQAAFLAISKMMCQSLDFLGEQLTCLTEELKRLQDQRAARQLEHLPR